MSDKEFKFEVDKFLAWVVEKQYELKKLGKSYELTEAEIDIAEDAWQEATHQATEAERQRCIDEFTKWGIENLNLYDLELLEYFISEKLEVK